jgi:hypothetical protein
MGCVMNFSLDLSFKLHLIIRHVSLEFNSCSSSQKLQFLFIKQSDVLMIIGMLIQFEMSHCQDLHNCKMVVEKNSYMLILS